MWHWYEYEKDSRKEWEKIIEIARSLENSFKRMNIAKPKLVSFLKRLVVEQNV